MQQLNLLVRTRWMILSEAVDVAGIDELSFSEPWDAIRFSSLLRATGFVPLVAIDCVQGRQKVVGYMVYKLPEERVEVIRLAVHPDHRRQGIGRMMLAQLRGKLGPAFRRYEAWIEVPEDALGGQLWLKSLGLRCERIDHSAACEPDVYQFVMGLPRDEVTQ